MELTSLKGIGPKTAELFNKLGIHSCEELIESYPLHYESYDAPVKAGEVLDGMKCAVIGQITGNVSFFASNKGLKIVSAVIRDETGLLRLSWYNMPYIRSRLVKGAFFVFRGIVRKGKSGMTMEHPEIFSPAEYEKKSNTLTPIYGLTKGLSNNTFSKAVAQAMAAINPHGDYLPESYRKLFSLPTEEAALKGIHFPKNEEEMTNARKRLVFDEFFLFIMAIRLLKEQESEAEEAYCFEKSWETEEVISRLPFKMTGAQLNAWHEIENDMTSGKRMSRLLQGDVGSGKTIVSFLALSLCVENNCQGALMAPTEVLARQHYRNIQKMIEEGIFKNIHPVLLVGSMKANEKREATEKISSGEANVVIGTHALIQQKVLYKKLALVITDEQHRFGVRQRQEFTDKGLKPHMLVMSATPIPRTMGVVIYSDMAVSVINEMPGERLKIKTAVVDTAYRPSAYRFIKKQIEDGHQAYIVCPLIEESEGLEAENVMDYARKLKKEIPEAKIGILHGRMKSREKDSVMAEFSNGHIDVLVSTTVVEVGVDVPNATVMMVENAERFGLAALHQLRGRVGRGKAQSYCIFVAGMMNDTIKQRLDVLSKSHDGLEIAQKDFEIRGSGDLLGIRQSGASLFKIADIFRDEEILKMASDAAASILKDDPYLMDENYLDLSQKIKNYLSEDDKNIIL